MEIRNRSFGDDDMEKEVLIDYPDGEKVDEDGEGGDERGGAEGKGQPGPAPAEDKQAGGGVVFSRGLGR